MSISYETKRLDLWLGHVNTSVIRQEGESQNRCFKKTKHAKYSANRTFLTPEYQGVRNVHFFGKFDVLCFLETPVLRFAFLSYYRQIAFNKGKAIHGDQNFEVIVA